MNFDARRNNELERGGITTGSFCHLLDVIKHRADAAQRNTHESQASASAATRFMADGVNAAI